MRWGWQGSGTPAPKPPVPPSALGWAVGYGHWQLPGSAPPSRPVQTSASVLDEHKGFSWRSDTNISLLFLFFLDLHNVCIVSMEKKKKKMPTPPWSSALQLCLLWWWVAWHPWLPAALQLHSSHANCPSQHWVLSLAPALGSTRQSQVLSLRSALSATTTGCQRARVKIITSKWKHKYYQHRWLPCHWT